MINSAVFAATVISLLVCLIRCKRHLSAAVSARLALLLLVISLHVPISLDVMFHLIKAELSSGLTVNVVVRFRVADSES